MVTIFIVGIIVALVVEEVTGITPGGIIVPGFLALAWGEPWRMGATIAAALATVLLVQALQRFVFVYGRRRFAYCVLTGIVLKELSLLAFPVLNVVSYGMLVIGFVIPGLLADNCLRQGIFPTTAAAFIAVVITRFVGGALIGWMP